MEGAEEERRDIFRDHIQHLRIKKTQANGEKWSDFDEARGRKRDRESAWVTRRRAFFWRGLSVDQVSFVSYFKGIGSFHLANI